MAMNLDDTLRCPRPKFLLFRGAGLSFSASDDACGSRFIGLLGQFKCNQALVHDLEELLVFVRHTIEFAVDAYDFSQVPGQVDIGLAKVMVAGLVHSRSLGGPLLASCGC